MKYSMIALCAAIAFAMTGCKYDDADASNANGADAGMSAVGSDIDSITGNDGIPATGLPFDQDPNYKRCTDVDFQPVYFGFDASTVPSSELGKVEEVANHLAANPTRVVMVEGNCDERGSNEYNLSLGDLRAQAVRDYLLRLGVDAQRIQTKSYGEEKPAVSGSGEEVWSRNRRGEFAIFTK